MRGYLRVAARHPGRAARVLAELETLLEAGPTEPVFNALYDAGIPPEALQSSDGKDPDDFFALMLPHLRKFIASGERIEDAVPESGWEWRERYTAIRGLLAGGFHMDSLHLYPDREAIMEDFLEGSPGAYATEMLRDLDDLRVIAPTEDDLKYALYDGAIGCGLLPPKGMTGWEWMNHIADRLRRYERDHRD
ncbi:contact-dependent growth inhibition system immunity protein [Streptomyces sp. NPDC058001]|uniref:contact-dependent growth inhibition system immunity protein n=1 Tax=Streptomyces sp. NPDC058001 TaxID=3346300 RepID=UPI0036E139A5